MAEDKTKQEIIDEQIRGADEILARIFSEAKDFPAPDIIKQGKAIKKRKTMINANRPPDAARREYQSEAKSLFDRWQNQKAHYKQMKKDSAETHRNIQKKHMEKRDKTEYQNKGGIVGKKPKFMKGGSYKGKSHMYAAGGMVKELKK